ncbi:MAG: bifunctional diguanylate cyclase/phosphodiesterase [Halieaceae bacterium]|jgi:EAL domain-containing protein (putative c-di-GMP-specific phosphodiesterase class I)/GGDEF domain-containing protein|nr:bifunctional diguanylate cyclase/phosphodiesterase [Halieaceae bacterium]
MSSERKFSQDGKVVHLDPRGSTSPLQSAPAASGELGATLCRELLAARSSGQDAQLLVFRISNFDLLVDTFGPDFGSAAEAALLHQLRGLLRRREPVQRILPGEFGIVGRGIRCDAALKAMTDRMVEGGTGHYEIDGVPCRLKLEIGAAACPGDSDRPDELLHFARFALRELGDGLDSCRSFSRDDLDRRKAMFRMEAEMEKALEEQRFILQYQPQFAVSTGAVSGMEALIRLVRTDGSRISPADFIPLAEDNGFIVRLGYWIIREACQQLSRWRRAGLSVPRISINVSPHQLLDQRLLEVTEAAVAASGLEMNDLEFEITERCMVEHSNQVLEMLHELRRRGVRLAIDDFGTGYSSFAYLAWQPLDIVKLDRSFLARVGDDDRIDAVVRGMIAMARQLGLGLVAEGVENEQQADFLRSVGCDVAQGFALAHPQDPEAITQLLIESECA